MKITDLLSVDDWVDVEKDIVDQSGLCASVFDDKGVKVTRFVQWSNELCPKIKGDRRGLSQICALANQTMAAKARETRLPVIDECDIGLAKVVVPIYVDGEFLGTMGGCGRLFEDGEVETFLVSKTIDCPEEEAENLAESVGRISRSDTQGLADYLLGRVHEIVRENS